MLSDKSLALLALLADGCFHSGEALGQALGVSRAAVWKALQSFTGLGLEITRSRSRGYRIEGGLELLKAEAIRRLCNESSLKKIDHLDVLTCVNSTNNVVLDSIHENPNARNHLVCVAEMQALGRGRRRRVWRSPFARNIYFSLSWQFDRGIAAMQGLSLAVGLAVAESLESLGGENISLKWPNDILCRGQKLGGILIEIAGDASGICHAVIGIGINVDMPDSLASDIDQAWTDFASVSEAVPSRNHIVATLIDHLTTILSDYQHKGFYPYRSRWQKKNAFADKPVRLSSASNFTDGIMRGVSENGALLLEVEGEMKEYVGGELSVRLRT